MGSARRSVAVVAALLAGAVLASCASRVHGTPGVVPRDAYGQPIISDLPRH